MSVDSRGTPQHSVMHVLDWLGERGSEPAVPPKVLVVAAHPDDEVIGLGSRLSRLRRVTVLHVTDGAPRERRWWGAPHLASREEYARVRQEELTAALALAGVGEEHRRSLDIPDQEASSDLAGLARRMADVLAQLAPDVVLTHAYEGGHPDHDATTFAVHSARHIMEQRGARIPLLMEFTSYHARQDGAVGDGTATGDFIPVPGAHEVEVALTAPKRELKRRMLAAFASQRETLTAFGVEVERFRVAPAYDFTAPPHSGALHYENFDWGFTGDEWRTSAGKALAALGIGAESAC
ncbi:MAG: PIG-L deacetylase family protein [Gemmatimonadaceae bacterium]